MVDALAAAAVADDADDVLLPAVSAAAVAAAIAASTDVPARVCATAADAGAPADGDEAEVAPLVLDDVVRPTLLGIADAFAAGGVTETVGTAELGATIAGTAGPGDIENGVLVTACGAVARAAALADPWAGAGAAPA